MAFDTGPAIGMLEPMKLHPSAARKARPRAIALALALSGAAALAGPLPLSEKDAKLPPVTMPEEFALVFSFGYVNDFWPKDEATFERTLQNMQRTGINTIHCKYFEWRQTLCEKYGVRMMIDLAVPEHDLKQAPLCAPDEVQPADLSQAEAKFAALKAELDKANEAIRAVDAELKTAQDKAELEKKKAALLEDRQRLEKQKSLQIGANVKAICEKVRGSKGVWGYGLWYDNGTSGGILNHAVEKLRTWDPSHVTFVGSYRHGGLETVTINPGCYGWYDFHWQRGILWHYLDMMVLQDICQRRGAIAGNYAQYSGLQQDLFTMNQLIASGVKMVIWFIGGPMSRDTYEWSDDQELVKIAAEFRPMYRELMRIGPAKAFYSTPVTRDPSDKPCAPGIPRWFKPFPADGWVQAVSGEVMVGFFRYADRADALYVANHNALAPQEVKLQFKLQEPFKVLRFSRADGGWKELPATEGAVGFPLAAGGGELLRVEKAVPAP